MILIVNYSISTEVFKMLLVILHWLKRLFTAVTNVGQIHWSMIKGKTFYSCVVVNIFLSLSDHLFLLESYKGLQEVPEVLLIWFNDIGLLSRRFFVLSVHVAKRVRLNLRYFWRIFIQHEPRKQRCWCEDICDYWSYISVSRSDIIFVLAKVEAPNFPLLTRDDSSVAM